MSLSAIVKKYDIRGCFLTEFDGGDVEKISKSLLALLRRLQIDLSVGVVMAKDSRAVSAQLCHSLSFQLLSRGCAVTDLGVCPTPSLSFFLQQNRQYRVGVMVTSSHCPWSHSGLKITVDNKPLWGDALRHFFTIGQKQSFGGFSMLTDQKSANDFSLSAKDEYLSFLHSEFSALSAWQPKFVLDCMHGAALALMPDLISRFGWQNVVVLRDQPSASKDASVGPDCSKRALLQPLLDKMAEVEADFGVAFDGDADRVCVITAEGKMLAGDQLLAIFASRIPKGSKVVTEVKSSQSIEFLGREKGFTVVRCATGHPLVREKMQQVGAVLGGEFSGHIFFADRYFGFDDATYALLRLFEIMQQEGLSLQQLLEQLPDFFSADWEHLPSPEVRRQELLQGLKKRFVAQGLSVSEVDGVKVFFDQFTWALVRASNTSKVLTVRVESDSEKGFNAAKASVLSALAAE